MSMHAARPPFWMLLTGLLTLAFTPVWAQVRPFSESDKAEIRRQAKNLIAQDLPTRINNLVAEDINEADLKYLTLNCYLPNEQQLFVNDQALIEDDVDPDHTGPATTGSYDKTIAKYLSDLLSFYAKNTTDAPSFIITNVRPVDPVVENPGSALIDVYYDSVFKGKHKSGRSYQTVHRKATLQAMREGNSKKWNLFIRQILFLRPPVGIAQTATTAPVAVSIAETPPLPPIEIREPLKVYRQEDYEFNVTLRYNKKALDVVKAESPRVPLGQYRANGDGTYELAGNSIRFNEADKNKFTYKNRDRDIMGFVLVQPPAPKPDTPPTVAAKPLPDVVTPGYLPPNEEQRKRKAEPPVSTSIAGSVAVSTPKITPPESVKPATEAVKQPAKPVVEPPKPTAQTVVPTSPPVAAGKPTENSKLPVTEAPKPVATKPAVDPPKPTDKPIAEPARAVAEVPKRQAEPVKPLVDLPKPPADHSTPPPISPPIEKPVAKSPAPTPPKTDIPNIAEQEKQPKSIIQKPVALSVSPDLKKSLTGEQQRIVAGMRLRGWLQVVGGLAALGGSYVAYSGIKKDYDAYSQKANALNEDYNLYRDLSRRTVPPPPNVLSMTQYGSPTIYGVYGGGVTGLGLTVNGIRTLLRAGKMSKKK